jgi:hypothetical protein
MLTATLTCGYQAGQETVTNSRRQVPAMDLPQFHPLPGPVLLTSLRRGYKRGWYAPHSGRNGFLPMR